MNNSPPKNQQLQPVRASDKGALEITKNVNEYVSVGWRKQKKTITLKEGLKEDSKEETVYNRRK